MRDDIPSTFSGFASEERSYGERNVPRRAVECADGTTNDLPVSKDRLEKNGLANVDGKFRAFVRGIINALRKLA